MVKQEENIHRKKGGIYVGGYNDEMLFGELSEKWLENRRCNTKESTYMRYTEVIKLHILPHFSNYMVSDIDTQALQSYLLFLINEKTLSKKTISDILVIIKSILKFGEQINARHNCLLSAVSIKPEKKEMRVFNYEEHKSLTEYLVSENSSSSAGMLIALYTGIRIGELCALKYDDIDITSRKIHISKTMQRIKQINGEGTHIHIDTPKSMSSIRDIPLTDFLYDIIISQKYKEGDYILTASEKYVEPRTMQYRFSIITKKLGIKNATFHTMRHSFATRCVEAGFDIKTLSEILGHSNVNITLDRYVHSSFNLKFLNMKKLDVYMNNLT